MRSVVRMRPHREAVVAAAVAVVTLAAGMRLIALSTQHHASQARESAQITAVRLGSAIEAQLQAWAERAEPPTGGVPPARGGASSAAAPQPAAGSFWLASDGLAVMATAASRSMAVSIAAELAAELHGATMDRGVFGPIRQGSQR